MVEFLKQNKVVVVLQGRFAGQKTVSACSLADGTHGQPYGRCLVVEIAKYPKKEGHLEWICEEDDEESRARKLSSSSS